jgi:hypothetical protein
MSLRTKYPVPAAAVIASDLIIEILPRDSVEWLGTRAQLEAEGLVPREVLWPDRDRWIGWTADGFEFWLRRARPLGMKGPKRLWIQGDWWALRQTLLANRGKGHWPAVIYEKKCELDALLWSQSDEGQRCVERWQNARSDRRFQSFKNKTIYG